MLDIDLNTIRIKEKWLDLNFSHLNTPDCHMIDSRFNFIGNQGSYNQNNCFIRPSWPYME